MISCMVGLASGSVCRHRRPGLLSRGWLSLELVRQAFQDLEVLWCTFHIKKHQSYKHQPEKDQDEHKLFTVLFWDGYRCWYNGTWRTREADSGQKLSFPTCRFLVVASELSLYSRGTSVLQNGWIMGGRGVRIAKMLILLSQKVYKSIFKFLLPFENCFPRCRFRVVSSTLSQEGKNMVAMFTKLACLHALLISFLYMSVCSLYTPVYSR